jgi:branched-chain amino acid transport system permease protein
MQRTGVPIPIAFVGTLLITAVVSLVIGAICVRLKEIYFAFVTLAFQMLIHSMILSWASLTGGDQGLRGGIPRPVFLGIDLTNHIHLYFVSCALLVIGLLLMRQIAQSPFGYTLRMIRDNATRASFIGINVWRAKLTIFVLAALFASTGGIIMSLFVSGAYPEFAYWTISGEGIFINMLGGVTTFLGPIVGTVLLLILNDTVTRLTEYYGIVLGIVILFFAIGLRKGLMDFAVEWYEQRRDGARGRAR